MRPRSGFQGTVFPTPPRMLQTCNASPPAKDDRAGSPDHTHPRHRPRGITAAGGEARERAGSLHGQSQSESWADPCLQKPGGPCFFAPGLCALLRASCAVAAPQVSGSPVSNGIGSVLTSTGGPVSPSPPPGCIHRILFLAGARPRADPRPTREFSGRPPLCRALR